MPGKDPYRRDADQRYLLSRLEYPAIISRIKIRWLTWTLLKSDCRRTDGSPFETAETQFDIRYPVLPTLHEKKMVVWLLDNDDQY